MNGKDGVPGPPGERGPPVRRIAANLFLILLQIYVNLRVNLAPTDRLEPLEWSVCPGKRARRAPWASLAKLDRQEYPERRVYRATQEKKDLRDRLDLRENLDRSGRRVCPASREKEVLLDCP